MQCQQLVYFLNSLKKKIEHVIYSRLDRQELSVRQGLPDFPDYSWFFLILSNSWFFPEFHVKTSDNSLGTIIFYPVTLTSEFDPFLENFNLANNFWTVSAKALIFHISISCDKAFRWVPLFMTLWPWPWRPIFWKL